MIELLDEGGIRGLAHGLRLLIRRFRFGLGAWLLLGCSAASGASGYRVRDQSLPFSAAIHDAAWANESTVSTGGAQGAFLRSADAGKTWSLAATPCDEFPIHSMTYDSAGEGWAVGGLASSGTIPWAILRSRDGGRSWGVQEVLNGSPEKTFTQVLALRDGSLVILGREGRCSKDGGRTWIKRAPLPSILRAVSPEGRILIGLGDRGRDLWHSEDGGASWRSAVLPELPADSALADLSFADARNGWCVGSSGSGPLLLQTRDGGRRWTLAAALGLPEAGVFSAVQFQDAQIGFLSSEGARPEGSSRLHCTKDGGGTWTPAWEGEEGARISRLSRLPGGGVLAVGARRGRAFVLTLEPGP